MRRLMIAAPAQLRWALQDNDTQARFENLPEQTRATVLSLLARLIAKGVLASEEDDGA